MKVYINPWSAGARCGLWLVGLCLVAGVWGPESVLAQSPLSPYTSSQYTPDGDIGEFINYLGDSQAYFVTNNLDPSFGLFKAGATFPNGVFSGRDIAPAPGGGGFPAGPTGFQDVPGSDGFGPIPTGFNIGRIFMSFNPDLDPDGNPGNGTGVYFLAIDSSAPSALDGVNATQPIAFDVDGDGSVDAQTEILAPFQVSEAPLSVADEYRFQLDPDNNGTLNVEIVIAERGAPDGESPLLPPGAIPLGAAQFIENDPLTDADDGVSQRYVLVIGIGTGTEASLLPYLDWNGNSMIDEGDFGIGDDLEVAVMNVTALPFNSDPTCLRFVATADTFDDVKMGGGAEDRIAALGKWPAPKIDVVKSVRCADDEMSPFAPSVSVLPGATVEFRITVDNTGNRDLDVTLDDALSCMDPAFVQLVADSCTVTNAPAGLIDDFCGAFESAMQNPGEFPLAIGTLLAAPPSPVNDPDNSPNSIKPQTDRERGPQLRQPATRIGLLRNRIQSLGAVDCRLVFMFRARVGPFESETALCDNDIDCTNFVSVVGTADVNPLPDAEEELGDVDDEFQIMVMASDDAAVEIGCRAIELLKEVRHLPDGPYVTGDTPLDLPPGPFPLDIEYRYTVTNLGETDEVITIEDAFLCTDLAVAPDGVDYVTGECELCETGAVGIATAGGGTFATTCRVRFDDLGSLQLFLTRDDNSECRALTDTGAPDPTCYRNCATATAEGVSTPGVCADGPIRSEQSEAEICNRTCDVEVTKEIRCLPDCDSSLIHPEAGWVGDPQALPVAPGACVQYRITIENISDTVPLCGLRFVDLMSDADNFASGPDNVQVSGDSVCANAATDFNWNATPVDCAFAPQLQPGESMTIVFEATLKPSATVDAARHPLNQVHVLAAGEGGCSHDEPLFSCESRDQVPTEINVCAFEVTKDVTCDDPRNSQAVFDPEIVEAIPGATVGFRIRVCNTGDSSLESLTLTDVLDCSPWFVSGSVVADIDGTNVTGCVCPGGVCTTISDLNGEKSFGACGVDALDPDQCLTITFEIGIPADYNLTGTPVDCTNTITVAGRTDLCLPPGDNPCDEQTDDARVDIDIPEIDCNKQVCADINQDGDCLDDGDFPFTNSLELPCNIAFPFRLTYRMTASNTGETPLNNVQVCDPELVDDALAAGLVPVDGACRLNLETGCALIGTLPSMTSASISCSLDVPGETEWESFASRDTDGRDTCYDNTADASGEVDAADRCIRDADRVVSSDCSTEVCLAPGCAISVDKKFRCVDGCGDRNAIGELTDSLMATPGATVEFEIRVTNDDDDALCALQFEDTLTGPFEPCPERECHVQVINGAGNPTCNVAPDWFQTDGTAFALSLFEACGVLLEPTNQVVIRCAGTIPSDATGKILNRVGVLCAPDDGDHCSGGAAYCGDRATADANVQIKPCGLEVTKDVTCDDPRSPNAVFDPDIVQATPGAKVGFRITVCNAGEANVSSVHMTDVLDCAAWFVSGSAVADIDGTDVTACVCPGGVCTSAADLNGDKSFGACGVDVLGPGQCLTITFEVQVPADFDTRGTDVDCTNTVTVGGSTDICSSPEDSPCDEATDDAKIDVDVPNVECDKVVCADRGIEGDCDGDDDFSRDLLLPCEDTFPVTMVYRIIANNTGELPLGSVEVCDADLVADAADAGLAFGACDLNPITGCAQVGPIAPGGSAEARCEIIIPDLAAWDAFSNDPMPGVSGGTSLIPSGVYRMRNHPDGDAAPPYYGLRLDGLYPTGGGSNIFSFDFDHAESDMILTYDGDAGVIEISGVSYGGRDIGNSYDGTYAGLWEIYFRYEGVVPVPGDDDVIMFTPDTPNEGWIKRLATNEVIDLYDYPGPYNYTFRLGDEDDDSGHRGFAGISGWGWLNHHDPDKHVSASDWLFTLVPQRREPNCHTNHATVHAEVDTREVCAREADISVESGCEARVCTQVEVVEPRVECEKGVCVDRGRDEDCKTDNDFKNGLELECDESFPLALVYRIVAHNTGPAPLSSVEVCDGDLIADATAAGAAIGPCDLNLITGCTEVGPIAIAGAAEARCTITFPNRDAWDAFADAPSSPGGGTSLIPSGVYLMRNHPDGGGAPPFYGLRLDGLYPTGGGSNVFSFDFDHSDSAMYLTYNGNTGVIEISGVTYGGRDIGNTYDGTYGGLWEVHFSYNDVTPVPGDDDLIVYTPDSPNTGWIKRLATNEVINLYDYNGSFNYTARFGDEDDDNGHRGFAGISMWGWLNHHDRDKHIAASDWLCTLIPVSGPSCYDNTATVSAEGGSGGCTSSGGSSAEAECSARVCLPPPCNECEPGIQCDKTVCGDKNNDGDCHDSGDTSSSSSLDLPDSFEPPFTIVYKIDVTNTGDSHLNDVQACDQDLMDDVQAADLQLLDCDLDPVTGCASIASLAPGETARVTCAVKVYTTEKWNRFTGAVGSGEWETLFWEDFNGYTSFPDEYPDFDKINKGLPLVGEGADETWYGGRFEIPDGGDINSDLAVQKQGGGDNDTPCGRVADDAAILFKVNTEGCSEASLRFDWRTFSAASGDKLVAGYFVGEIDFVNDSNDGTMDDRVHDFVADGPAWDSEWTQLLRGNGDSWKSESFALPTGKPCIWVAFWLDNGNHDFGKVDNVHVKCKRGGSGCHENTVTVRATAVSTDSCQVDGPRVVESSCDATVCCDASGGGGGEGCNYYYWKTHKYDWPHPYNYNDDFDNTFGVNLFWPNKTLLDALYMTNSGESGLAKQATAALLNAASADVDYALSVAEVKALVQSAVAPGGDVEGTRIYLESLNSLDCPLD